MHLIRTNLAVSCAAKRLVRTVAGTRSIGAAVRCLQALPDRRGNLLRVLTYHRVAEDSDRPDLDATLISASPGRFARDVAWLMRDYELISLADVLAALNEGPPIPPRAVLLTFDDAYGDFAEHAWPVLRRCSAPAAVFVPTAFPDGHPRAFWWDRLHCALLHPQSHANSAIETPFGRIRWGTIDQRRDVFGRLKSQLKLLSDADLQQAVDSICRQTNAPHPGPAVMSWEQLRQIAAEGATLVPHTHTHPLLDQIPSDSISDEIQRSRLILEERIGGVLPVLAYPTGNFNPRVVELARRQGIELALTTLPGMVDLRSCDPLRIPRVNVCRHTPDALLRMKLTRFVGLRRRAMPTAFPATAANLTAIPSKSADCSNVTDGNSPAASAAAASCMEGGAHD